MPCYAACPSVGVSLSWTCNYLLHQLNAGLQVHSEIDKHPVNALLLVLFLLKYEHVVVKELLQFLVCEVDAQLFEAVVLDGGG